MLIQKGAVRKPHLPQLETAKLTLMVRLGNRTYRPENKTNPVNFVVQGPWALLAMLTLSEDLKSS